MGVVTGGNGTVGSTMGMSLFKINLSSFFRYKLKSQFMNGNLKVGHSGARQLGGICFRLINQLVSNCILISCMLTQFYHTVYMY